MPEIKLVAEPRTQFGKGAARKIRRDHKIPAVLYGHGTAPVLRSCESRCRAL